MSKPGLHSPCPLSAWEAAYLSFETPEEEIRKFIRRLRRLGAERLPRQAEVLELFCGRGNGLRALERLGFNRLEGVDLSISLLSQPILTRVPKPQTPLAPPAAPGGKPATPTAGASC
jgi:hypothetical protein